MPVQNIIHSIMNIIQSIINIISAIGVLIIGVWQIKIHNRLKQLEESIALSVVPDPPFFTGIRLINSGKINLYLKKAIIGEVNLDYPNLVLIARGKDPYFLIGFSQLELKEMSTKDRISLILYLQDEWERKYLVKGEIFVTFKTIENEQAGKNTDSEFSPTGFPSSKRIFFYFISSAWVSQIKKYNWKL